MANVILVIGETSSGKSSAIRTLNPEETLVIKACKKVLPFKGGTKNYSVEKKNLLEASDSLGVKDSDGSSFLSVDIVIAMLNKVNTDRPEIKTIIIDDAMYLIKYLYLKRIKEKSYDKYTDLTEEFRRLLVRCQSLRDDINVYLNLHPASIETENKIISYQVSTPGKMINNTINPLENVTIVLFAKPRFSNSNRPEYGFYTNSVLVDGIVIPAKSPEGMFEDEFIPNDLAIVNEAIYKYFNEDE